MRGLEVFVADEQSSRSVDPPRWAALARSVLAAEGVEQDAELSVIFVDEEAMAHLNKKFLGKDGPTDVLAFPVDDEPAQPGRSPDSGGTGPGWMPPEPDEPPDLLGDVVICPEVAWRNASGQAGNFEDEIALLVVHGILHLMGRDHLDEPEAAEMERREQELLDRYHRGRLGKGDVTESTNGDRAGDTGGSAKDDSDGDTPITDSPAGDADSARDAGR